MIRAGLFGIGLSTYWPQFDGLKPRLEGYMTQIANRLGEFGAEVIDVGLVDSPASAEEAGIRFRREQAEVVFLYISTYALSSTVLPAVQRAGVPVVVLNLQPVPAIDYEAFNAMSDRGVMTGEWLAHCQACSVPEIANVLGRAGVDFHLVTGHLHDDESWNEIQQWIDAAYLREAMRTNTLGMMGHYYMGMLDVYSDLTAQSVTFGTNIELIEIDELIAIGEQVTETDVATKISDFRTAFEVSEECEQSELERAARTSVALDRLAERHRLGSLAYYYEGEPGNVSEEIVTSVIAGNTMLTGRHIPVAGECEIKNAQAMKILDLLGAGGSFSEYYAMDFNEDVILLGHDGPAHFAIAEGRVKLVPLPVYHGKPGKGLSIQMSVKQGPVTILSVCQNNEEVYLLVAEGDSVPGPVLQIGNTNSRYRFPIGIKEFVNRWSSAAPSHHCAVGIGHVAATIEKFGKLVGIRTIRVC